MTDTTLFTFIVTSIFIMIVLALAVLVIFNTSQKRILKDIQETHERELAHQTNLLASNIKIQEQERSRIAKELHDDIGSKLNILNLNFNLLKSTVPKTARTDELLESINLSLGKSINRTRQMAHQLLPPILTKFGLESAIQSLADEVSRSGSITFECDLQEIVNLSKLQELHLYRILQELTSNTIKYAEATKILFRSFIIDHNLVVRYSDNGKGLEDTINLTQGLGIDNIKSRVQLLGGEVTFKTSPGNGIEVTITIPHNKN